MVKVECRCGAMTYRPPRFMGRRMARRCVECERIVGRCECWCSNCGQRLSVWACGIVHGLRRMQYGIEWDGKEPVA